MMIFGLLLLPLVLAVDRTVERDNFVLTCDDTTLKDIHLNGASSDVLDLSNLNIESVDEHVFANLNNLKTLNFSNNRIRSFDEFTFTNLTNLEYLNLANNPLSTINFSHGLKNLKILDIMDNLLYFRPGVFYGLPISTNILTSGSQYGNIYTATFENPSNLTTRQKKQRDRIQVYTINLPFGTTAGKPKVKVCVEDGRLKSLDVFNENETLSDDCREIDRYGQRFDLTKLGITTIDSKWYRLQEHHEPTLSFYDNEIVQVTKELLNDLPAGITILDLMTNKIERLERGVIDNVNPIKHLNLRHNVISEIEDGALENLNLTGTLFLDGNKLKNTKFLDSLPENIVDVRLTANGITEISAGNFSKFTSFGTLDLSKNNITVAKADCLREFWSLKALDLSRNGLQKVEPGFFHGLKNLKVLHLDENDITSLDYGVFAGLESITSLSLHSNKLSEIRGDLFSSLPNSLERLNLQYNLIETLKTGTFVNEVMRLLELNGNKISKIEKGCFNLPNLEILFLQKNLLTEMDGDSFEGLPNLDRLSLSNNVITTIKKRAGKNLNSLTVLELSNNPIKRLENGALFGLSKTTETRIEMYAVILELIQPGLFDDV